jgi:hypothetical protein
MAPLMGGGGAMERAHQTFWRSNSGSSLFKVIY